MAWWAATPGTRCWACENVIEKKSRLRAALFARWEGVTGSGGANHSQRGAKALCAYTSSVSLWLTPVSLRVGRFAGLTGHRPVIQHREPLEGKAKGIPRQRARRADRVVRPYNKVPTRTEWRAAR